MNQYKQGAEGPWKQPLPTELCSNGHDIRADHPNVPAKRPPLCGRLQIRPCAGRLDPVSSLFSQSTFNSQHVVFAAVQSVHQDMSDVQQSAHVVCANIACDIMGAVRGMCNQLSMQQQTVQFSAIIKTCFCTCISETSQTVLVGG